MNPLQLFSSMFLKLRSAMWRVHFARYFLALPAWHYFRNNGPHDRTFRVCLDKISGSLVSQSFYHDGTVLSLDSTLSSKIAQTYTPPDDRLPFADITKIIENDDLVAVLKSVVQTGIFESIVEYYSGSFYVDKLQIIRTRSTTTPSSSELWHRDCNDANSIHFVYCFSTLFAAPGFSIAITSARSAIHSLVDKLLVRRIPDHRFRSLSRDLLLATLDKPGQWLVFNPSRLWHKLHTRDSSSVYLLLTFCSRQPYYPPSPLSPKVTRSLYQALASESRTAHLAGKLSSIAFTTLDTKS